MKILAALFFAAALPVAAQKVEVPHKMRFADLTLIIRDDARREIQKDVDALTASPRHYQIKAERAKTYFPIIEKIFREEQLPDDFKYLVLQESALISDAVSSSNAVGFWQFKDFTAAEMGLRMDRDIDERLNIAASTRAAARYLKKNNQFFDNWLYALQAYQMGAGGVMRSVKDTQAGVKRMEITADTYWYVKKFLAHKIAFEGGVSGTPMNQVVVYEHRGSKTTLDRLAREARVDALALKDLNKWTRSGVIPEDRAYVVLLPAEGAASAIALADATPASRVDHKPARIVPVSGALVRGKVNGVHTVQALEGDDVRRLTARAMVDVPKFLKWNDMEKGDQIVPGRMYFLGKKRLKGSEAFHKVAEGETLWEVSQRYGLRLKRLKRYNRIEDDREPAPGTMLYLASRRPKEDPVLAKVENAVEVDEQHTFNWAVRSTTEAAPVVAVQSPPELPLTPEVPVKDVDSVKILQADETATTLREAEPVPVTKEAGPVPVTRPENDEHIVKAGETLYGIARTYNLTVMQLVEWNALRIEEGIKPGQILRLSEVTEAPAAEDKRPEEGHEIFHEVRTSDTLYSIARQYNVTIKQIMEWNEKKDFSLSVGEKLRILRTQ